MKKLMMAVLALLSTQCSPFEDYALDKGEKHATVTAERKNAPESSQLRFDFAKPTNPLSILNFETPQNFVKDFHRGTTYLGLKNDPDLMLPSSIKNISSYDKHRARIFNHNQKMDTQVQAILARKDLSPEEQQRNIELIEAERLKKLPVEHPHVLNQDYSWKAFKSLFKDLTGVNPLSKAGEHKLKEYEKDEIWKEAQKDSRHLINREDFSEEEKFYAVLNRQQEAVNQADQLDNSPFKLLGEAMGTIGMTLLPQTNASEQQQENDVIKSTVKETVSTEQPAHIALPASQGWVSSLPAYVGYLKQFASPLFRPLVSTFYDPSYFSLYDTMKKEEQFYAAQEKAMLEAQAAQQKAFEELQQKYQALARPSGATTAAI